ncbi:MAG: hypothetical protein ILO68_06400 [Clostridia bacterium]|nr:hypothetical protein [Clostridia bacterium]
MPDTFFCAACGAPLSPDDLGASRKLINRGLAGEDCLCLPCLSARFRVPEDRLKKKIEEWREAGCMLFPPRAGDDSR